MIRLLLLPGFFAAMFLQTWTLYAQVADLDEVAQEEAVDNDEAEPEILPPLREYKGREIAQTMHYLGAPWLIRDRREREEDCKTMLKQLGVQPGMTICDMGCGNGFYALKMATLTGKAGKILGVDIQPEMLRMLDDRAQQAEIENIDLLLGTPVDPKLPAGQVDLILCVDVYHEFSHPEQMLAAMRKSLKPKGRVVLVEFRTEDRSVPIKRLHKMSKDQIMKELPANGYKLVHEFDGLPWQHMMFFGRDDSPEKRIDPKPYEPPDGKSE